MQKLWTGLGISELDVALQRVIELTYKGLFTAHALNWNWFDRAIHGAFIGRARQRHVSGVIRFDWLSKIGTVSARLVFNTCIPMRPAVNAAVRELEFNSLHMVWTSVNCVNVKTRQDNECRRAQVYPLCPHLPYTRTILYHYIQTGRPPVPISSELKL